MLSILDRVSRREWLRVGGLSAAGLTLADVLRAGEAHASSWGARRPPDPPMARADGTFGKAKNCIYLWLQGGPPQHETFDPKPDAPVEIRGPFKPVATNVPGIRFCELLPRTARHADKLAVVRSLSTRDDNHDVSGYWLLTGYPYGPGSARQIKPTDWPYFGSLVKMLKPSRTLPALSTVWLPDLMRLNDSVTPAGQTAGFLGKAWEPERIVGDPAAPDYRIEGVDLAADMRGGRFDGRRGLLAKLERGGRDEPRDAWAKLSGHAFDLITSGKARAAFDLGKEPERLRDRYGRHTWGQSCLLARRLIEAGVRLVHVNWARDPGDNAVDNPMWDTHAQNADRLQDSLCPMFDVSFDALMEDLAARGLLDETLVVVIGEFGRTPRINKLGGRDHWGHVFSCALAGAGVRGGQVIGASDRNGAYPVSDPVRGGDLTATIFHLLGIDPNGMFPDKAGRPHPLTKGQPLTAALGLTPATDARCRPGGDVALVPPYDARLLLDTAFDEDLPLVAPTPSRAKGWRASPGGFTVKKDGGLVIGWAEGEGPAVLGQEIRNARGGHYTFTVNAAGLGATEGLTFRLVLFRFKDMKKDVRDVQELAAAEFRPTAGKAGVFKVDRYLGSAAGGANFAIGNGLGVAVVVSGKGAMRGAGVRIQSVTLEFSPKERDPNTVA